MSQLLTVFHYVLAFGYGYKSFIVRVLETEVCLFRNNIKRERSPPKKELCMHTILHEDSRLLFLPKLPFLVQIFLLHFLCGSVKEDLSIFFVCRYAKRLPNIRTGKS